MILPGSVLLSAYRADVRRYEAELYVVESTALTERFTLAAQTNDYWDDRNRAHVVHLALLAVLMFFRPMPSLADEAINAYARGVGLVHQEKPVEAVAEFSRALDHEPSYTN